MRWTAKRGASVTMLVALIVLIGASSAAADPQYSVMNAEGGIYWRSEPNWSAAEAISGFGVYNGTTIEVHCYQSGSPVPGSADTMWEQATDVGGPGYGSGWLNEHFINDGQPIDQPSPGVPPCGSGGGGSGSPLPPGEFEVMNASGGIYWRSAPDWNTPEAVAGNGFYSGTVIAVQCYQSGAANVPGSTDAMWELARQVSGSGSGSGWINEYFINDGSPIGQPSPGAPACATSGSSGSPQLPPPTPPPPVTSPPTPSEQVLAMDPDLWCVKYDEPSHFEAQIKINGWIVVFKGAQGGPHQNNWTCTYLVTMDLGIVVVPVPVTEHFPIDFRAVCQTQFPGAQLRYSASKGPWPWECVGQAGKYYPPPSLAIRTMASKDGYVATGLPALGPGQLSVELTSDLAHGRAAGAARAVVIGSGLRTVARKGRYSVRVRLTHSGRLLLGRVERLDVTFVVRFRPRTGSAISLYSRSLLGR